MTWAALSTPERVAKVRSLDSHGVTRTNQATALGIRLSALSQFCTANGLRATNDNTFSEWAELDDNGRRERLLELREDGLSVRAIAAELGVSHPVIYAWCRANGLDRLFERRVQIQPPLVPAEDVPESTWNPVVGVPKTLMDLEDHDCRWPVHGGFCGCRQVLGSYCEVHALMAKGSCADA